MFQNVQIVLLLSAVGALAQMCPPAADLSPCTCNEVSLDITCFGIQGRFDIQDAFDRVSPMVDDSVIFNSLNILETSLLDIPAGSVETLKFRTITINYNENLESISSEAFNATTTVTTELSLRNNHITNVQPNEREIFELIQKFTALEEVSLSSNRIQSIPDAAFGPSTTLTEIYLGSNDISYVGSKVFAQLPNLKTLYIDYNALTADSFATDAFERAGSQLDIDLQNNNKITYLPESVFKPLLDNSLKVTVGGSFCGIIGCTYDYLDCNEEADWLCQHVSLYMPKLSGYRCNPNGPNYPTVWEYCSNIVRRL